MPGAVLALLTCTLMAVESIAAFGKGREGRQVYRHQGAGDDGFKWNRNRNRKE